MRAWPFLLLSVCGWLDLAAQTRLRVHWEPQAGHANVQEMTLAIPDSSKKSALTALEEALSDRGFFDARIDSIAVGNQIVAYGRAGSPFFIRGVAIFEHVKSGAVDSMSFEGPYESISGLILTMQDIPAKSTPRLFTDRIVVKSIRPDTVWKEVEVTVFIRTQEFEKAAIRVSEADKMPVQYLEKLTGIDRQAVIKPENLGEYRRILQSTGLFKDVDEGNVEVGTDRMQAVFNTENLPLQTLDAVLGWIPDGRGGGALAGNLHLRARSLLTEGSAFTIRFERQRPAVSRFEMEYQAEFFGNTPFGSRISIDFFQQDSAYQVRNFQWNPFFRISPYSLAGVSLRSEQTAAGIISAGGVSNVRPTKAFTTGLNIRHRQFDDVMIPRRGFVLSFSLERGTKTVAATAADEIEESARLLEVSISSQVILPVTNRWISVSGFSFSTVQTPVYSAGDLFRLGGAQSLRGYQEQQFSGVTTGWADQEIRFLADRNTYLFGFAAAGRFETVALEGTENTRKWSPWLKSAGFGLADRTRLGLLRVSYAFSTQTGGAGGGLVHVSVTNGF